MRTRPRRRRFRSELALCALALCLAGPARAESEARLHAGSVGHVLHIGDALPNRAGVIDPKRRADLGGQGAEKSGVVLHGKRGREFAAAWGGAQAVR